jgi:hypothetical protein
LIEQVSFDSSEFAHLSTNIQAAKLRSEQAYTDLLNTLLGVVSAEKRQRWARRLIREPRKDRDYHKDRDHKDHHHDDE